MVIEVFMPRLTHDMTNGKLLRWCKREGDEVKTGETLFEVETDKAISEVEAEADGVLHSFVFQENQDVPVGAVMAFIIPPGEDLPTPGSITITPVSTLSPQHDDGEKKEMKITNETRENDNEQRVIITPIARKLAKEHKINIHQISGSGPRGKIIEADIRSWVQQQKENAKAPEKPSQELAYDVIQLTEVQRITGQKMIQSATSIPQFTLEVDVNMAEAMRLREFISSQLGQKISLTTLLVHATAKALKLHPRLNSSFVNGEIHCFELINIGIAAATTQGLVAPVIHQADKLTLMQIQERINHFQALADGKSFSMNDLSNGTFTISNLGMYGIDRFTALINPPQAAILTIGKISQVLMMKDEKPVVIPNTTLRLSVDHRILDGANAAPFLVDLKQMVENPGLWQ